MENIILDYNDSLVRTSDYDTLSDGNWLNDSIIGFVMEFSTYNDYYDSLI